MEVIDLIIKDWGVQPPSNDATRDRKGDTIVDLTAHVHIVGLRYKTFCVRRWGVGLHLGAWAWGWQLVLKEVCFVMLHSSLVNTVMNLRVA